MHKPLRFICVASHTRLLTSRRVLLVNGSRCIATKIPHRKVRVEGKNSDKHSKKSFRYQKDIYGLPDSVSNIPPITFAIPDNETPKERRFREFKQDLTLWHQQFWTSHNERFKKDKKAYLNQRPNPIIDEKIHADDLSLFYKDFLDKNFRIHLNYQREWYKKNLLSTWYGLQVQVERIFKRFTSRK